MRYKGDESMFNLVETAHPLAIKLNKLLFDGDNTTSFEMTEPTRASNFQWDDEVFEFFETIHFLGGERARNFVKGPFFIGSGQGGLKTF